MKVSAAMTTYNGKEYLPKQLDSLRTQLRPFDEVIVCDDASFDGTPDLLQKYQFRHRDFPMYIHRGTENIGFEKNFLRAIRQCSGDVIFCCDQDDIWEPQKVLIMCRILSENPGIMALACSFTMIDGKDEPVQVKATRGWSNNNLYPGVVPDGALVQVTPEKLVFQNICQGCALAFRQEIRDEFLERFTEGLHYDWQLALLAAAQGGLWFCNQPLIRYRIHSGNALGLSSSADPLARMSLDHRAKQSREGLAAAAWLKKNAPEVYSGDPRIRRRAGFLQHHLENLEKKRTLRLLLQMADPLYRELRQSPRGRGADLLYTLQR